MRTVHHYFAFFVAAANLVVGGWGLWRYRRKLPATTGFWRALGVAWASVIVQGVMGLTLFQRYEPPVKHTFYGFLFAVVMLIVWPLRGEDERRRLLVFASATTFIGIVAIRAIFSL